MGEYRRFDASTLTDALRPLYADLRRFAAVVGGMDVEPDDLVQEALVRLLVSGRLGSVDDAAAVPRRGLSIWSRTTGARRVENVVSWRSLRWRLSSLRTIRQIWPISAVSTR